MYKGKVAHAMRLMRSRRILQYFTLLLLVTVLLVKREMGLVPVNDLVHHSHGLVGITMVHFNDQVRTRECPITCRNVKLYRAKNYTKLGGNYELYKLCVKYLMPHN